MLGGTSTAGGVSCWETGTGGTGIPFDIYQRIKRDHPDAIGIYSQGRHFKYCHRSFWPDHPEKMNFPGGELLLDPERSYIDTLRRHPDSGNSTNEAFCRENWHGVPFLPDTMAAVMREMLDETGCVTVLTETEFSEVDIDDGFVRSAVLDNGSVIRADYWADGAGGVLCESCGCEILVGTDPRQRYNEPDAPAQADTGINGVTLVYRVSCTEHPGIEQLPAGIQEECWWAPHFPLMQCVQAPDMSRVCNMLPTIEGEEYLKLGYDRAYEESLRRIKAHWHFIHTFWPEFRDLSMSWTAPLLGIREEKRVVCETLLTENDILAGLSGQDYPDIVAVSDHALDRHGTGPGCTDVNEPYGIPFRCLIPAGWKNLAVVCRAAGFSSLAASSSRLTRTMMQLGQAAGTAVAMAGTHRKALACVDPDGLRKNLGEDHVQLEWPLRKDLAAYIADL